MLTVVARFNNTNVFRPMFVWVMKCCSTIELTLIKQVRQKSV